MTRGKTKSPACRLAWVCFLIAMTAASLTLLQKKKGTNAASVVTLSPAWQPVEPGARQWRGSKLVELTQAPHLQKLVRTMATGIFNVLGASFVNDALHTAGGKWRDEFDNDPPWEEDKAATQTVRDLLAEQSRENLETALTKHLQSAVTPELFQLLVCSNATQTGDDLSSGKLMLMVQPESGRETTSFRFVPEYNLKFGKPPALKTLRFSATHDLKFACEFGVRNTEKDQLLLRDGFGVSHYRGKKLEIAGSGSRYNVDPGMEPILSAKVSVDTASIRSTATLQWPLWSLSVSGLEIKPADENP
jgi:hypothetical protein